MRLPDPDHSIDEGRYVLLGMGSSQRLLSVAHAFTDSTQDSRIIPGRRSTPLSMPSTARGDDMRREYDFSKGRKNPYAAKLTRSVTIRIPLSTIAYFKGLGDELE